MSEGDSNSAGPADKPSPPKKRYPEFPRFPYATGRWAKKIMGRLVYFVPWADTDAVLAKYLEQ